MGRVVMDGRLRDWYLSALGISNYRLRVRPDVAAGLDSVIEAGSVVEASSIVEANGDADAGGGDESARAIPTAVNPMADGAGTERAARVATEMAHPSAVHSDVAKSEPVRSEMPAIPAYRQRIACWQPVPDLLVLNGCTPGQTPGPADVELLSNILRAVNRLPGDLPLPQLIDWPPTANVVGDLAGARTNLAMFLAGRVKARPFTWVLAMGEDLMELLAPDGDASQVRIELDCGATAIFTSGLANMVSDPAQKAATWAAIRFLGEG